MENKEINELIKEYRNTHNAQIAKNIYSFYRKELLAKSFYIVLIYRSHQNFDINEYESYIYENFIKLLSSFDLEQTKYTFEQALLASNRLCLIKEICKSIKSIYAHRSLIKKMTVNELYQNQINFHLDNDLKNKQQNLLHYWLRKCNKKTKCILQYKMKGYSTRSISRITKVPERTIRNIISNFVSKVRKNASDF